MTVQPWEVSNAKERAELGRATLADVPTLLEALRDAESELEVAEAAHQDELADTIGDKDRLTEYVEDLQLRLKQTISSLQRSLDAEDVSFADIHIKALCNMAEEDPYTYVAPKPQRKISTKSKRLP